MMSQTNGNSSGATASSTDDFGGTSPAKNTTDGTNITGTSACNSLAQGFPLPSRSALLASGGPPPDWIPGMAIQRYGNMQPFANLDLSPKNDPDYGLARYPLSLTDIKINALTDTTLIGACMSNITDFISGEQRVAATEEAAMLRKLNMQFRRGE